MKYGLARKISIYDIDNGEGEEFVAPPAAYIQASLWSAKHLKGLADEIRGIYENYAWAWFAARLAGLCGKYGMDGELTREKIDELSCRITIFIDVVEDDALPLNGRTSKRK
ncbi:hypothetical protein [Adlercreutzia caecimuris]|uniref:hypothetical protein n=1 Tax=Adlercreutzia caecimuris TaxID=671266 RepID=UPI00249586E4|nr:hypothetical protein [Adlercreutzia caecimuris]